MSENNDHIIKADAVSTDYVSMYYQRQYARMEHHESQRLTLSNVVITITVLGFTFGFGDAPKLSFLNGIGLPLVIIIANAFAIVYAHGSSAICRTHQKRAHVTLERYALPLYLINKELKWPKYQLGGRLTRTLICLHVLLIAASFLPIAAYVISIIKK